MKKYHTANRRDDILVSIKSIENNAEYCVDSITRRLLLPSDKQFKTHLTKLLFNEGSNQIENYFESIEPEDLLILSSLMIGLGRFYTAFKFRELALGKLERYQNRWISYLYVDLIIGKLIESLEFNLLPEFLIKSRLLLTPCGRSNFNRKLYTFIKTGEITPKSIDENKFSSIVNSKSIAVIGPLELSLFEREEAGKHDLVIRLNELDIIKKNSKKEPFPDVVYYTGKVQEKLLLLLENAEADQLPLFLVGKKEMSLPLHLKKNIGFRIRDELNPFTFNGGLNLIPRVIADLLLYKPSSIKVFGVDLYTSLDFDQGYHGDKSIDWEHVFDHFINHDIITQYKFMHSCYVNGLIEADERLTNVLDMGIHSYLSFFENKRAEVLN